jgi:hypothetical protein
MKQSAQMTVVSDNEKLEQDVRKFFGLEDKPQVAFFHADLSPITIGMIGGNFLPAPRLPNTVPFKREDGRICLVGFQDRRRFKGR